MLKSNSLNTFIVRALWLIVLALIASASSTQVYAAPHQQVAESRNFDAVIVDRGYSFGARGARDCRTGQLIDLGDGNFGQRVQVGRTYHFENAWIFEGNPGQLFFLISNSQGFRYYEISGCPSAKSQGATISADKTQLRVGEQITFCYTVPGPSHIQLTVFLPDGSSRDQGGKDDDGTGGCFSGTTSPPVGVRRLRMSVSSGGKIIATAETSYEVLPEQTSLPPAPDGYTWVSKEEYDYIHQQLVDAIREWDESLSFQAWLQDRDRDLGRDKLFEKIGDIAVRKGFGNYLSQIVGTAQSFLSGTRADVLRNKKLYEDRLFIMEARWNLKQFRNGDYVLLPWGYRDLPVAEFPLWWEFWSDWMFWDMGN